MSGKEFLIQHGEKLILLLVVAICGLVIYSTFTSTDIRPVKGSKENIAKYIETIKSVREGGRTPVLELPHDFLATIDAGFAASSPIPVLVGSLTAPRDLGPVDTTASYLYGYELLPPKVEVTDTIGSLSISLSLPDSIRGDKGRITDGLAASWKRRGGAGTIVNTAAIAGVILEMQVGSGPWTPLASAGDNGFIPVDKIGDPIVVDKVKEWEWYHCRARSILVATGFVPGATGGGGGAVLVKAGRFTDATSDDAFAKLLGDVATSLEKKGAEAFKGLLPGLTGSASPVPLKTGVFERAYLSTYSAISGVRASSTIRYALKQVSPDINNPNQFEAHILVTRYMRAVASLPAGWLPEPQLFRLKLTEPLKGTRDVGRRGHLVPVRLDTPYILAEAQMGQSRILYYEIHPRSRPNSSRGRDLEIRPHTQNTDLVVLRNEQTKESVTLMRLAEFSVPPKSQFMVIDPDYPPGPRNEEQIWRKDPGRFQQPGLVPPPPIPHKPGTGPLVDILKSGNPLAKTDTTYFECADGRLVYWEPVNDRMVTIYRLDRQPVKAAVTTGAPPPPNPTTVIPAASSGKAAAPAPATPGAGVAPVASPTAPAAEATPPAAPTPAVVPAPAVPAGQ